jgi:hypothetical protein
MLPCCTFAPFPTPSPATAVQTAVQEKCNLDLGLSVRAPCSFSDIAQLRLTRADALSNCAFDLLRFIASQLAKFLFGFATQFSRASFNLILIDTHVQLLSVNSRRAAESRYA